MFKTLCRLPATPATTPGRWLADGPPGEEIYCDEYGRVKVQFPWDRYSAANETASCWIRLSQGWAGGGYGSMVIPRIGHEVIVSFLEGDPDQPIITGRTYHATNTPADALPANKTRSGFRTRRHPKANPLPGRPATPVMRRPTGQRPRAALTGRDNVKANGQPDLYIP